MQLETVKVASPVSEENPLGYVLINASDLTPDHVLFTEGAAKPAKSAAKAKPAPRAPEAAD